ncbi:MAG: DUF4258 domain-containing protein [Bacteriovoracaceae bacterium]|nr:DUF4258 domain-containing protein [Bacteriovoracaceae bacterium]
MKLSHAPERVNSAEYSFDYLRVIDKVTDFVYVKSEIKGKNKEELRQILRMISSGDFFVSFHAEQRMQERFITKMDIMYVGKFAISSNKQEHGSWLIEGQDVEGDSLSLVCTLKGNVLIATVF